MDSQNNLIKCLILIASLILKVCIDALVKANLPVSSGNKKTELNFISNKKIYWDLNLIILFPTDFKIIAKIQYRQGVIKIFGQILVPSNSMVKLPLKSMKARSLPLLPALEPG